MSTVLHPLLPTDNARLRAQALARAHTLRRLAVNAYLDALAQAVLRVPATLAARMRTAPRQLEA